ncbi:MAG TPA: DUF5671 domain-containing protein, partial [Candidatus Paceibacterota bacterium]|nr:DUF5671 domain-containing protein [Candidatus Paceibacterota bacterium]
MNTPRTTAKDFFLWAGAMVAFYWAVISFIYLIFNYINYAFPNVLQYYPVDPYQSGISGEMASIIVLLPAYLFLMRLIRRDIAADPGKGDIWVRRWAVILTLFVAGAAIAVDLITLLTTFLNGEALTTAFLLKVLVVLLVAAGVFMHFIADLRGYWTANARYRNYVGIGVAVLAIATIASGFVIVGTPGQARLARFDAQKVQDLMSLQSQITYYWQAKQTLPPTLADLTKSSPYASLPMDPQTGLSYVYKPKGAQAFELCATFNAAGLSSTADRTVPVPAGYNPAAPGSLNDWSHP